MKDYDKNIESSYLMYLDANNLYGWGMSQRLPVNGFEQMEQLSEFDGRFIKKYDENNDKGTLNIQKIYLFFIEIYHFYLKEIKFKNSKSLFVTYMTKKTMLYT